MQAFEDAQHAPGAQSVAPLQRPQRIAETEAHRQVDVLHRSDTLLGDVAGEIDDRGEGALDDEPGAVANQRDAHAVPCEQGASRLLQLRSGRRAGHQAAVSLQVRQHVDGQAARRIDGEPPRCGADVGAQWRKQAQRRPGRTLAALHLGAQTL